MCRNIKTLFNFDPPVTPEEVRAASLQFVRKISGFNKPSQANEASFAAAVDECAAEEPRRRDRQSQGPCCRALRFLSLTGVPGRIFSGTPWHEGRLLFLRNRHHR